MLCPRLLPKHLLNTDRLEVHDHIPLELGPVLDQALSEDLYPNIQSDTSFSIPSHAITEEISTFPSPASYRKGLHSNELIPQVIF